MLNFEESLVMKNWRKQMKAKHIWKQNQKQKAKNKQTNKEQNKTNQSFCFTFLNVKCIQVAQRCMMYSY